jgi:hypothetical protein
MKKVLKLAILFSISLSIAAIEDVTLQEQDFPISGPNCHNTALRELGLTDTKRYIHNHEMKRFLKNRCFVSHIKRSYQLGIIELIDTGEPMHGFVNLGNDKVLTKDGVLKRTLPRITSFIEMEALHKAAIFRHCRIKKIVPCKVQVKYYSCDEMNVSLKRTEQVFSDLTAQKYSFYNLELRKQFNETIINEDFSHSCQKKKEEFHSMVLALKLANMSSRTREEQELGEEFFKENLNRLNNISCEND